jgi:fucose permease
MTRTPYLLVAIAYISFIGLGISAAIIGVLWSPHILNDFGQSLEALSAYLLMSTVGYFLGSSISGRVFSRYPVGWVLAGAMALTAVSMAGFGLSPAWWVMVGLSALMGLGTGLLDGGMNIYFAAHFNARLMNWLHASFGVGALVAPQLVNLIVIDQGASWRWVYGLVALGFVVMALAYALTRHLWLPIQETGHHSGTPYRATLRLGAVWMGIIIFIAYTGAEAGAGTWMAPFFQSQGIAEALGNNWVTAYWLSFTVGRILFGTIATRFAPSTIIRLCLLLALGGLALLAWRPVPEANLLGVVTFGFALSPCFALLITATQERLGPVHAPNAIGLQVAAASLGGGILPALMGATVPFTGIGFLPFMLMGLIFAMLMLYQWSLSPSFAPTRLKQV